MTPTETATVLRQLTDWRRGVDVDPPKPGEVFEAIDAAIEMIERLEAAEKEVAHIKEVEFPRKMRAVAVGWEKKCARLEQERDALRAKIEAMEQQEPVGWLRLYADGSSSEDFTDLPDVFERQRPLYALPGAKGEEK